MDLLANSELDRPASRGPVGRVRGAGVRAGRGSITVLGGSAKVLVQVESAGCVLQQGPSASASPRGGGDVAGLSPEGGLLEAPPALWPSV